jgi:hypothetical protein
VLSRPVAHGDVIYAGAGNDHVKAVRARDGEPLWRTPVRAQFTSDLLVTERHIYGVDGPFLFVGRAPTPARHLAAPPPITTWGRGARADLCVWQDLVRARFIAGVRSGGLQRLPRIAPCSRGRVRGAMRGKPLRDNALRAATAFGTIPASPVRARPSLRSSSRRTPCGRIASAADALR